MKLLRSLMIVYLAIAAVLVLLILWGIKLVEPFGPLRVTVVNETDAALVSVESGIVSGSSKHTYRQAIEAGESARIKPELSLSGEGAVYQKFYFSGGEVKEAVVCGYTESLSGTATVTLRADGRIDVEQSCS
ncbi:hypothetical protein [Cohnella hongkongensis]|uniref:Uncharacterized protein n=1 Tax=Cohnella hongkongensis TaxID=178337 RepID=A0ABV9F6U1_9BACL